MDAARDRAKGGLSPFRHLPADMTGQQLLAAFCSAMEVK
jgi:hypothetical protein